MNEQIPHTSSVQPNIPQPTQYRSNTKVKKGVKISFKTFFIGCLGFGFLFFLVFVGFLFYVFNYPGTLKTFGLSAESVRTLLKVFIVLFFGIMFFSGFIILSLNIYRLTSKKGDRIKNIMGTILGFFLVIFGLGMGGYALYKVGNMSTEIRPKSDKLVLEYWETKDRKLFIGDGYRLIAPATISFELNKDIFMSEVVNKYGIGNMGEITVDCGSGQLVKSDIKKLLSLEKQYFGGNCVFMKKGEYPVKVIYTYLDNNSGRYIKAEKELDNINIATQVDIRIRGSSYKLNNGEVVVGEIPANVDFISKSIYSDLGISKPKIEWDFNGDNQIDAKGIGQVTNQFKEAGLNEVYFNIPDYQGFEDVFFGFNLRVNDSNLPGCSVDISRVDKKTAAVSLILSEPLDIQEYKFIIKDSITEKELVQKTLSDPKFVYDFPDGRYKALVEFRTTDGEKGKCESDEFDNSSAKYTVNYEATVSRGSDQAFNKISGTGQKISIDVLPSTLRFEITKILPDSDNVKVKLYYDGKEAGVVENNVFEVKISDKKIKPLEFVIQEADGKQYKQPIDYNIKESPLRAKLRTDKNVGDDPLEVELDASISELSDTKDEIVYFSWDFGDGETLNNVSDGKVKHTYIFDKEKNNGVFYPQVTVQTKNGVKDTVKLSKPISVKKGVKDFKILVESHPTQIAPIGEVVSFAIETDGTIKEIQRDFGNGKKTSCQGRECSNASATYEQAGTYTIKATVKYEDYAAATRTINIKVR